MGNVTDFQSALYNHTWVVWTQMDHAQMKTCKFPKNNDNNNNPNVILILVFLCSIVTTGNWNVTKTQFELNPCTVYYNPKSIHPGLGCRTSQSHTLKLFWVI